MSNALQCPKCGGELPADPSMEGLCPRCLLVLGLGADEANREKIGGYEVLSELGRGGMGVVYKAYQVSLNRIVALKVLSEQIAQDKAFVRRFEREAKAAAQLSHPNVVTIHDIGCEGDTHFIAMECVEGRTISQLLEEHGQLDVALALRITQQVLKALAAAHERGIIHRDIKARNVLIDDADCVKVADFGLAKSVEDTTEITNTGALLGTPAYMSPEQCMGETVDPRTDLYGVGVLLYHMLAGRVPFAGKTPAEVFHRTVHEPVPAIHQFNSSVPEAVWRILQRALSKEPEDRYGSAREMELDVEAAVTHYKAAPTAPMPQNIGAPAQAPRVRRAFWLGIVGVAVTWTVMGGLAVCWGDDKYLGSSGLFLGLLLPLGPAMACISLILYSRLGLLRRNPVYVLGMALDFGMLLLAAVLLSIHTCLLYLKESGAAQRVSNLWFDVGTPILAASFLLVHYVVFLLAHRYGSLRSFGKGSLTRICMWDWPVSSR